MAQIGRGLQYIALLILPSKADSRASASQVSVPGTTASTARDAAPATAVLVTGPCCHFGVAMHVARIALPDGAAANRE